MFENLMTERPIQNSLEFMRNAGSGTLTAGALGGRKRRRTMGEALEQDVNTGDVVTFSSEKLPEGQYAFGVRPTSATERVKQIMAAGVAPTDPARTPKNAGTATAPTPSPAPPAASTPAPTDTPQAKAIMTSNPAGSGPAAGNPGAQPGAPATPGGSTQVVMPSAPMMQREATPPPTVKQLMERGDLSVQDVADLNSTGFPRRNAEAKLARAMGNWDRAERRASAEFMAQATRPMQVVKQEAPVTLGETKTITGADGNPIGTGVVTGAGKMEIVTPPKAEKPAPSPIMVDVPDAQGKPSGTKVIAGSPSGFIPVKPEEKKPALPAIGHTLASGERFLGRTDTQSGQPIYERPPTEQAPVTKLEPAEITRRMDERGKILAEIKGYQAEVDKGNTKRGLDWWPWGKTYQSKIDELQGRLQAIDAGLVAAGFNPNQTPAAGQAAGPGGMVMIEAPDGSRRAVPRASAQKYVAKGGRIVG